MRKSLALPAVFLFLAWTPSIATAQYMSPQQVYWLQLASTPEAQAIYNLRVQLAYGQAEIQLAQAQVGRSQAVLNKYNAVLRRPMPNWQRHSLVLQRNQLGVNVQLAQQNVNVANATLQVGQADLQVMRRLFYLKYGVASPY